MTLPQKTEALLRLVNDLNWMGGDPENYNQRVVTCYKHRTAHERNYRVQSGHLYYKYTNKYLIINRIYMVIIFHEMPLNTLCWRSMGYIYDKWRHKLND